MGTATSFRFPEQGEDETCLVGMWVAGHARGGGVREAQPARNLYGRMGFRPTGRRGVLLHDESIVELEMALEL